MFRNESAEYARRLVEAGVTVEYIDVKCGFHEITRALAKKALPVVHGWRKVEAFSRRHLFY